MDGCQLVVTNSNFFEDKTLLAEKIQDNCFVHGDCKKEEQRTSITQFYPAALSIYLPVLKSVGMTRF